VVIFLHGIASHAGWFGETAAHLNQHGVAVYGPDRRGSGRSGGPRGHLARYERALDDLAQMVQLVGSEHPGTPVFLVASSWAAKLAVVYVAQRPGPLSGLVLHAVGLQSRVKVSPGFRLRVLVGHLVVPMTYLPIPLTPEQYTANPPTWTSCGPIRCGCWRPRPGCSGGGYGWIAGVGALLPAWGFRCWSSMARRIRCWMCPRRAAGSSNSGSRTKPPAPIRASATAWTSRRIAPSIWPTWWGGCRRGSHPGHPRRRGAVPEADPHRAGVVRGRPAVHGRLSACRRADHLGACTHAHMHPPGS